MILASGDENGVRVEIDGTLIDLDLNEAFELLEALDAAIDVADGKRRGSFALVKDARCYYERQTDAVGRIEHIIDRTAMIEMPDGHYAIVYTEDLRPVSIRDRRNHQGATE